VAFASPAFSGSAFYGYRLTETTRDGARETSWQQIHNYRLRLQKDLTEVVNFTGDLDINIRNENGEETTSLTPDLRLYVNNEYFNANAGYRRTERNISMFTFDPEQERFTTESWNVNFDTKSMEFPRIRLSYREEKSFDHLDVHRTDKKSTLFNSDIYLDYNRLLNFNYNFKRGTLEDYVTSLTRKTDTHEGITRFNRNFFNDKVTASGRYSLLFSESETKTRESEVIVEERIPASLGLYGEDFPLPGEELQNWPSLVDGDKTASTGINIGGPGMDNQQYIGFDLDFKRTISQIRLYTEDVQFAPQDFIWAVYYSDNNLNYFEITDSAAFSYDSEDNFFKISFEATNARYFIIVNIENDPLVDVDVTEIEAYELVMFAPDSVTTQKQIRQNLFSSLGYKPFDWLRFDYNMSWFEEEIRPDSRKTWRSSHNFSSRAEHQVHRYLRAVGQYQKNMNFRSDSEDTSSDTFLTYFTSSPLDTVDIGLSMSHTINRTEDEIRSKNTQCLLQTWARLREGLDLNLSGTLVRYQDLTTNLERNTRTIRSGLRAKLTPDLTYRLDHDISWIESDSPAERTTSQSSSVRNSLNWRPSRIFSFWGSYDLNWLDGSLESTRQRYRINWLMTDKMELSIGYNLDENVGTSQSFNSDLSWYLSSMFTLRFGFNWTKRERDTVVESKVYTMNISARF